MSTPSPALPLSRAAAFPIAREPAPTPAAVAFFRRLRRTRLALVGLGIVLLVIVCAIFAQIISPYDPVRQRLTEALQAPSWTHLLGTDENGRDILARVIHGSRASLQAGLMSVGLALLVGVSIGLLAGYFRGRTDNILMRMMDALLSFPDLLLALAITAALGPGLRNAMLAIGIVYTPIYARLTRGQVLSVREREYVEAARASGAGHLRIMLRHILPNVTAPLIVQASLSIALAILTEASLSFLGLGVQPPDPSWGTMINTGKNYLDLAPWMAFAPGIAILLTVMGFNFLGDAVRDALDPRLQRQVQDDGRANRH
jgi:peptide/nickel transport system permease protein